MSRLPELERDHVAGVVRVGGIDLTRDGYRVWALTGGRA